MSGLDSKNKRGSAIGMLPTPGGDNVLPEREQLAGMYRTTEGNAAAIIGGLIVIATLMPMTETIDYEAEIGELQAIAATHSFEGGENIDLPLGFLSASAELFSPESFFLEELPILSAFANTNRFIDMVGGDLPVLSAIAELYHPNLHIDQFVTLPALTAKARTWPLIAPAAGRTTVSFSAQRPKQILWRFQGKKPVMTFTGGAEIHSEILQLPTLNAIAAILGITGEKLNVIGTLTALANLYSFDGDAIGGLKAVATLYPLAPPNEIGRLEAVATLYPMAEDYELRTLKAIAELFGFESTLGTLRAIATLYPMAEADELRTLTSKALLHPLIVSGESSMGTLQAVATLNGLVDGVVSSIGTLTSKARIMKFGVSMTETMSALTATAVLNGLVASTGVSESIGTIASAATMYPFDAVIDATGVTGRLNALATLHQHSTTISCSASLSKLTATATLNSLDAIIT